MKWLKKVAATPLTTIARVVDNLNAQTNDRTNAPSIRAVNDAIANKWETIYPIGSIYMSVNNVDPSTVFGGTWQQIKDKFLLASGDTYNRGATGGSATVSYTPSGSVGSHTLQVNEIPSHSHNYTRGTGVGNHTLTINEIPSHKHIFGAPNKWVTINEGNVGTAKTAMANTTASANTNETGGDAAHNHPLSTDTAATTSTGSTQGHNHGFTGTAATLDNMPPYLAVNIWVRTA
jgi:microcystin-dependent protein